MNSAEFRVDVTAESALQFAEVSGDWNPLHTDAAHAAATPFHRPVLHGAYSAGLFSRMAGMYLPGTDCLLHSLQLRFVAPIVPPVSLLVSGRVTNDSGTSGRVEVTVSDGNTGVRYVDGSYGFGRHVTEHVSARSAEHVSVDGANGGAVVLVTGANGAIGRAVVDALGDGAVGVSRSMLDALAAIADVSELPPDLAGLVNGRPIASIVHCGWPAPDNVALTSLPVIESSVEHFISSPLRHGVALGKLLKRHGAPGGILVLLGSTAAAPGRHNYRMPLYSLGKSLVPELARILAVELGASGHRAIAMVLDVVNAGMNERMSKSARIAHAGRSPSGSLPTAAEVAAQLLWILDNRSHLLSGAVISITGGALP